MGEEQLGVVLTVQEEMHKTSWPLLADVTLWIIVAKMDAHSRKYGYTDKQWFGVIMQSRE
jgi:hypothetical protein